MANKLIANKYFSSYSQIMNYAFKTTAYRTDVRVVGIIDTDIDSRVSAIIDSFADEDLNDKLIIKKMNELISSEETLSFATAIMASTEMMNKIVPNSTDNKAILSYKKWGTPAGLPDVEGLYMPIDTLTSTNVITESYYNLVEKVNSSTADQLVFVGNYNSIEVGTCVVSMAIASDLTSLKLKKANLHMMKL